MAEEYRGYKIEISPDPYPENPRSWDNLGHIVCSHRRYSLGDENDVPWNDLHSWDEVEEWLLSNKKIVSILPLCALDHSGFYIQVGKVFTPDFYYGFDSGRIGFAYVTKEDLKRCGTKKTDAENALRLEVEAYAHYIAGDFLMASISKDGNVTDMLSGYIDYDEILKEAKEVVDLDIKLEAKNVSDK